MPSTISFQAFKLSSLIIISYVEGNWDGFVCVCMCELFTCVYDVRKCHMARNKFNAYKTIQA